jgi:hypothetical protein
MFVEHKRSRDPTHAGHRYHLTYISVDAEWFDAAQVFGTMRFQLNTARCHLIHAALHISYVCLRPELSDKKHHKKPVVVQIDD